MNVLQVTNKVLQKLREDPVTSTDESEYSSLIASFVADIHADCVEEHDWSSMRHWITLALVPDQREYNIGLIQSDGGDVLDSERPTTNQSHLVFDAENRPMAFLFDDDSEAQGEQIFACAASALDTLYQQDRALSNEQPYHVAYRLHPDNEGLELIVWPLPAIARTLRLQFWSPPEIVGDGTDDAQELLMPWRPVFLGALMMGLNERGEEIGEPGNIAERRYIRALQSSIEADQKLGQRTDQYEFKRD